VLPQLCSHYLLTTHDREKLTNPYITNHEKVNHLLNALLKKDQGWFDKFLDCLSKSTEGTGHFSLAIELKQKYEEELKRRDNNTNTVVSNQKVPNKRDLEVCNLKETMVFKLICTLHTQVFPFYLESQNGSSPYVFNVISTELVESLIGRIRSKLSKFCIGYICMYMCG